MTGRNSTQQHFAGTAVTLTLGTHLRRDILRQTAKDPAGFLQANREVQLSAIRNSKMARSSHAYVRGSTVQFYDWLEAGDATLPQGPEIWICGDCHIGNLGPLADLKGRVSIQIRDLDQTVIGNPAHDIVRLGLSLASAARGSDLPGITTVRVLEQLVLGYTAALAGDFTAEEDKSNRSGSIQAVLARSVRRSWNDLAVERLVEKERFRTGKRFWALDDAERNDLDRLFSSEQVRRLLTSLHSRGNEEAVTLLDAAYWLKGCSSLGRLRYAVLVRVGKGRNAQLAVVDVKEAIEAAAPHSSTMGMPDDPSERVLAGARALSPNLGNRMLAANMLGRSVFLRELMPQDLKLEVHSLAPDEASALAHYLGNVAGRAHGRQMSEDQRKEWSDQLEQRRLRDIAAPSWLWSSVVELIGRHEAAYLEHCRRHSAGPVPGAEMVVSRI